MIRTRATLLERLKNFDDHKSWQVFFDTYWQLIHSVAIKAGLTESEAQDVIQETLISVAKKLPDFKYDPQIGRFKVWLLNLTRWRVVDQLRKRQRLVIGQEVSQEFHEGVGNNNINEIQAPSDLEKMWDEEWERNLTEVATEKARRRISPKQYQIFDIYVNKGWEADKAAEFFSISVAQVYLAKHRVTDAIKNEVTRLRSEIV